MLILPVYDVTKYAQDHPGGTDVMVEMAGRDASEEFESAAHSEDALEIMDTFRVGKLNNEGKPLAPKQVRLATSSEASAAKHWRSPGLLSLVLIGVLLSFSIAYSGHLWHEILPSIIAANTSQVQESAGHSAEKRKGYSFAQGIFLTLLTFAVAAGICLYRLSVILNFGTKPGRFPCALEVSEDAPAGQARSARLVRS